MTKAIQSPPLTASWIERDKYEFSKADLAFFPADSLGARGKPEREKYPAAGKHVTLVYSFGEWLGDIAVRNSGVSRPRDHAHMKTLVRKAAVGDFVRLSELAPRRFKVELISSKDGRTIL